MTCNKDMELLDVNFYTVFSIEFSGKTKFLSTKRVKPANSFFYEFTVKFRDDECRELYDRKIELINNLLTDRLGFNIKPSVDVAELLNIDRRVFAEPVRDFTIDTLRLFLFQIRNDLFDLIVRLTAEKIYNDSMKEIVVRLIRYIFIEYFGFYGNPNIENISQLKAIEEYIKNQPDRLFKSVAEGVGKVNLQAEKALAELNRKREEVLVTGGGGKVKRVVKKSRKLIRRKNLKSVKKSKN